ncbi:cell envelope integrity protein TolA [Rhizobium sp. FKL33]|uniref:cell envelope integrity protein TolA n=1 Tax=Rhizobium sp. FKL33 TaxID=2562307 RepID=UPI0010BFD373|nr:cell envelope integrity protein TolA [Rhizobium sp. FKL33]
MRGSVITSVALHVVLLGAMLIGISPKPMDMAISEAMPVDLVPIEDVAQLQQGDKEAPKAEKSALDKTQKQDQQPDAMNAGENDFDLKSVPTPTEKPSNLSKAGAPEKTEDPNPQQDNTVQEADSQAAEDTAVEPAMQEMASAEVPKPELKTEPTPEPAKETPVEEAAQEEPLPDSVPIPTTRPKEEPKKVEKTEEKKPEKTEEKKKEEKKDAKVTEKKKDQNSKAKKSDKDQKTKKSTTKKDSDFNADEIASLLNKTEDNPGGAKRSNSEKALGAKIATGGNKLSQSELDALKGIIEKNWSIMPGQVSSSDIMITVTFELDENGEVVGRPEVKGSGGDGSSLSALESGAVRAVMRSAPFDKLPKDKYDTWSKVTVNFYPSEMM